MKGWWILFLGTGLITAAIHWRLASLPKAEADTPTVLLHFGIGFLVYLASLPAARHLGKNYRTQVLLWVFTVAVISLGSYLNSELLLSNEVHRYRWDGIVAEAGFNPYEVAPEDPVLANLVKSFDQEIPEPTRQGMYPPLAELMFYVLARLDLDSLFFYRLIFSGMAILCGLAFLPLCRGAGVPATRVTVFLWHPLLILETAANAHLETVAIFFLLTSLSLLIHRHHLSPMAALGISALVKFYPIVLFPLYLRRVPPYRVIIFFLVLVAGAFPFVGAGRHLWAGVLDYLAQARFNPGFFLVVEAAFQAIGHVEWTRTGIGLLGLGLAGILYFTDDGSKGSILRRGFYLALAPLLLGPVLKPWYVLWLIPFLALVRRENPLRMAFLYLTGSVFLAYLHLDLDPLPLWITWVEYGPVLVLSLWAMWRMKATRVEA